MAQGTQRGRSRRRLSLSVRLSLLILFAALAPLAAVVAYNDHNAHDALVAQATQALRNDASSKVGQIDAYLNERLADGDALTQLVTTPLLLACTDATGLPADLAAEVMTLARCNDPVFNTTFDSGSNCRGLIVGVGRDTNYLSWALFDVRGHPLLAAQGGANPTKYDEKQPSFGCSGANAASVPREDLAAVSTAKPWISGVRYDQANKYAYVQVYTPVPVSALLTGLPSGTPVPSLPSTFPKILGFMRATLKLDKIWSIVGADAGANGTGSAAFITDENGVRIATTNPNDLFTAAKPLTAAAQQLISSEQRFGANFTVATNAPAGVQQALSDNAGSDTFTSASTQSDTAQYQFVRYNMAGDQFASINTNDATKSVNPLLKESGLGWSYFVLSPLSTVTAVSDTQVRDSLISAGVIAVLAILIGLLVGRSTTHPVRTSVTELEGAAASLKALASRQQSSAGEQHWVVDACKTGLESVRYLSDAMNQAARRIIDASNWFSEYWDRLTEDQARRTVAHLQELAHYIDEAARRQQASSDRLDKAITVTMQVSDQLVSGASAATESASQLEQVVNDLQHVVGGSRAATAMGEEGGEDLSEFAQGYQDLPPAVAPRQIAGPAYQPAGVRPGAQSGWPSSAAPGMSQAGWGDYGQYPPAPESPYGGYNGNGNGYNGNGTGGYQNGSYQNGGYDAGQGGNPWGNPGQMPPDGRSRGGW